MVDELNWLTGITSPKKKIQIGSFHLDAKGNSGAREVSELDDVPARLCKERAQFSFL